MSEWLLFSICVVTLFLRQVPGLRAVSKRKKKSAPNAPTHTRPPPIDRIAAQRAQCRRNRDRNQPQQADLEDLAPAPVAMGGQGGNIPDSDGEDIQPDNNLEGLPIPNGEDDLGDEEEPVANSRRHQNLPPNIDSDVERLEPEEREEEEEASRRYQGEEQERERIAEREKCQNLPRSIPRVTLTLKPNPALPQPLATANNIVSH